MNVCSGRVSEFYHSGFKLRTTSPRQIKRYFHPLFWTSTSHGWISTGHELFGKTKRATTAARTDPTEKNAERAVTRYCLPFGTLSSIRVPSVGIEP